jgi:hypothetical protein
MMVNRSKIYIDGIFLGVNPNKISVREHRVIATQEVPGREGDVQQDMGSSPAVITFSGKIFTNNTQEKATVLRRLRNQLMTGGTKQMTAEIMNSLSTREYLVEDFEYEESGGRVFEYDYNLTVKQYTATNLKQKQVNLVNSSPLNLALNTSNLIEAQPEIIASSNKKEEIEKATGEEYEDDGFFGGIWRGINSISNTIGGWFT